MTQEKAEEIATKYLNIFRESIASGKAEDYFEHVLAIIVFHKLVMKNFENGFPEKTTDPDNMERKEAIRSIEEIADIIVNNVSDTIEQIVNKADLN